MKRSPLKQVSDKRKLQLAIYSKRCKEFKLELPTCEVCHFGRTTDVHHTRGRVGVWLLLEEHWLPVCRSCHARIHENPRWARENGYLV